MSHYVGKYSPSGAAKYLEGQGTAREQQMDSAKVTRGAHGAGGKPPQPADKLSDGKGMGYNPRQAAKCLGEWGRESDQPHAGDMRGGAKEYYGGE